MINKNWKFPEYRKFVGVDVWFKILNEKEFIEIKRLGKKIIKHQVLATQYPEMLLIQDMLKCNEARWEYCPSQVFEENYAKVI